LVGSTRPLSRLRNRRSVEGRLGWIVAFSLASGLTVALLLVAAPFTPVTEPAITGAVLSGFAVGWAVLFLLSRRFTTNPSGGSRSRAGQGLGGLLLLVFGSPMREVLSWVWPPLLVALVAWMVVRVQREMRSRSGRVQLYLVFTILAVGAVGGAWQTVSEVAPMPPSKCRAIEPQRSEGECLCVRSARNPGGLLHASVNCPMWMGKRRNCSHCDEKAARGMGCSPHGFTLSCLWLSGRWESASARGFSPALLKTQTCNSRR
jgi:hypothetical protein